MGSPYRAVIVGGTGAVGSALVRELLQSGACTAVTMLGRRQTDAFATEPGVANLAQHVVAMDTLEGSADLIRAAGADVAFSTLGLGQPSKTAREAFWKTDVGMNGAFARACKAAGVRHFSLLSAVGAARGSRIHYQHVKGEAEAAVTAPGFARVSLFRPSILATRNIRYGATDWLAQNGFPLVSWMLPARYHQIAVEDLARAMRVNAERPATASVEVLHYSEFVALL